MTKCPRCHSSMLLDYSDTIEGFRRLLRCIGCGREILADPQEQAAENQLLYRVRASTVESQH